MISYNSQTVCYFTIKQIYVVQKCISDFKNELSGSLRVYIS